MKTRRVAKSPLAVWLDANACTMREFSRRIGIPYSKLSGIIDGKAMPGVVVAYEIERLTNSEVPIESWLGVELGKSHMAALRSAQPKEFQPKSFRKPETEDDSEEGGDAVDFAP